MNRRLLAISIGSLLAAGALFAAIGSIRAAGEVGRLPQRFVAPPAWRADIVLVPSGDHENRRTSFAAALLLDGRVGRMVISGAGHGGDSAEVLAKVALDRGVPEDRLVIENRATNTYENMVFSKELIDALAIRKILIVTARLHARRAALTAERVFGNGVELKVEALEGAEPESALSRGREVAKIAAYAWKGLLPWSSALDLVR